MSNLNDNSSYYYIIFSNVNEIIDAINEKGLPKQAFNQSLTIIFYQ